VIPIDTKFRDASKQGLPLPQYAPYSRGSLAYKKLLHFLMGETVDRALIEESMALPETQPGPRPETPTLDEDPRQRYRFPVQCLMFEVADHALCIPLIDMGSVAPLDPDAMTRIPDSPDWLLGVLPHRECNLRIVDSAVLLGIQRRQVAEEGLHFLVFAEEDFAITCERLGEVVYLEDEDVRWLEGAACQWARCAKASPPCSVR